MNQLDQLFPLVPMRSDMTYYLTFHKPDGALTSYHNKNEILGVDFEVPATWRMLVDSAISTCEEENICLMHLGEAGAFRHTLYGEPQSFPDDVKLYIVEQAQKEQEPSNIPLIQKWIDRLNNMKENRANEWEKAPDGEMFLIDQMIRNTAESIRDMKALEEKAIPEDKKTTIIKDYVALIMRDAKEGAVYTKLTPDLLERFILLLITINHQTTPKTDFPEFAAIADCWNTAIETATLMVEQLKSIHSLKEYIEVSIDTDEKFKDIAKTTNTTEIIAECTARINAYRAVLKYIK